MRGMVWMEKSKALEKQWQERERTEPKCEAWLPRWPVVSHTDPTRDNLWVAEAGGVGDGPRAAWGALATPSGNTAARSVP